MNVAYEQEQAWLLRAQGGDSEAYAALLQALEPDLRRVIRRKIADEATQEDVLQEVFIRLYKHLNVLEPTQRLRPYAFRVARNACYDALRRTRAQDSLDDEPIEMQVSFTESHRQLKPDDAVHWTLLGLEVRVAIAQLPEQQREALLLFSEDGLSYAEIAERTGVTVGTVKSRLFYAKKNLRGYLKPATLQLLDEEFPS